MHGVSHILDLTEHLRGTVREFAAKEEAVLGEFRAKSNAARRRYEDEKNALQQKLPVALAGADSVHVAARERISSRHSQRAARIVRLHKSLRKRAADSIEDKEGRRKHRLQTETLQNQRGRETGIAQTEKNYAEYLDALAAEQAVLSSLAQDARRAFAGMPGFRKRLSQAESLSDADRARDETQLLDELRGLRDRATAELKQYRRLLLPALMRVWPVWVLAAAVPAMAVPILERAGRAGLSYGQAGAASGAIALLGLIVFWMARQRGDAPARSLATALTRAQRLHDLGGEKAAARRESDLERIETDFAAKADWITNEWDSTVATAHTARGSLPRAVDEKAHRAAERNEEWKRFWMDRLTAKHAEAVRQAREGTSTALQRCEDDFAAVQTRLQSELAGRIQELTVAWKPRIERLYAQLEQARAEGARTSPPWDDARWRNWSAPAELCQGARFGGLEVDLAALTEGLPKDPALALPGPASFTLPLVLAYPEQGSIVFETGGAGREDVLAAMNNLILRLLANAPPGRMSFTIFDPVALGQSFSGVMHLADLAEHVINSRIWTQANQMEQRLGDLNEHMEKVIQMYLRNEYATITEYNARAGSIAERYHFLVVADFPANFTETAARRLLRIATSGARCGVYTLLHWDRRQPLPADLVPDSLRSGSVYFSSKGREIAFGGETRPGLRVVLDPPAPAEVATSLIHQIGLASRDSNRIEVPFSQVAPPPAQRWTLETTEELRVAIGRTGATRLQYLAFGKGTQQHGLVAGKTGSGKSTLFHVLITNLSLWCRPEQVEFYLIDFKKGVEFKCYAAHRLPHARVVAIESDREFGLSVLQRLDDELRRRGDLFRKRGAQDLPGYQRAGGEEPLPRVLLIIDEFQEFFVEDDKVAQTASLLLDRIVRQGRAFGLHALLGSQTLGGAYTVARTTLGQMVVRIALQCNEADAYLIMDDSNPAPRLLSRPGEGIYNDTAGTVEGNSPFQVVWLPDQERDRALGDVRALADRTGNYPGPLVFEGNAPSEIRENALLAGLLDATALAPAESPRIWLGAPNSIKGPTEVLFHRQSGNHLLIVGHSEEATLAFFSAGLVALAAQLPRNGAEVLFCDGNTSGTPARDYLERVLRAVPLPVTLVKAVDLSDILQKVAAEVNRRASEPQSAEDPVIFVMIQGVQKFSRLRFEEDFGFGGDAAAPAHPAALLNTVICDGARVGIHVMLSCDTFNNVNRFLSRKALSEIELRVLFQMSANDSASLIDSPKAAALGLHRALYANSQESRLEVFRPYALPGTEWVEHAARQLARLHGHH
jgi:hypothetical protein